MTDYHASVPGMGQLTLTAVTRTQGAVEALKDGTVQPAGVSLDFEEVPVLIQAFRRMVRSLEFDVSEMAFTTYLAAKAHGKPFTALPVFLVRGFHHGAILRSAAEELAPADLEGRQVGVNRGYTVTTGVWARGILADEYGVDLNRITWVLSGDEHVAEYVPPSNVVPVSPGKDVPDMVASGELAAGIGIPADHPGVAPLIPDAAEAGYRALHERGLYPINHLVVVRDELLAQHPSLAADLFAAYAEAKNRYTAALTSGRITNPGPNDRMYQRVAEITGTDPMPYGIAPNRAMIDLLIRYAVDQKILDKPVTAEDIFAAGTHNLTA
jgi:ABC-type nitrate/sulfonate/bicarbonate transport system substrate-binding protein